MRNGNNSSWVADRRYAVLFSQAKIRRKEVRRFASLGSISSKRGIQGKFFQNHSIYAN